MNIDQAIRNKVYIEAFMAGKIIQTNRAKRGDPPVWKDCQSPQFTGPDGYYRIKPDKKVVTMNSRDFSKFTTVWIKLDDKESLVTGFNHAKNTLTICNMIIEIERINKEEGAVWSSNRVTWHKFEKEIEE